MAECKITLLAAHAALLSFSIEMGSFTTCLKEIGMQGIEKDRRNYSFGFKFEKNGNICGPNGNEPCEAYSFGKARKLCPSSSGFFAASVDPQKRVQSRSALPATKVSKDGFVISCAGNPDSKGKLDLWSIDHKHNLIHISGD
jgi:hypothetical protein